MNELSQREQTQLEKLEFESDATVLGYLAAVRASAGGKQGGPIQGWGFEYTKRTIPVNGDMVVAVKSTRIINGERILGLSFTIHKDHYSGGNARKQWFIPLSEFENLTWSVRGIAS